MFCLCCAIYMCFGYEIKKPQMKRGTKDGHNGSKRAKTVLHCVSELFTKQNHLRVKYANTISIVRK